MFVWLAPVREKMLIQNYCTFLQYMSEWCLNLAVELAGPWVIRPSELIHTGTRLSGRSGVSTICKIRCNAHYLMNLSLALINHYSTFFHSRWNEQWSAFSRSSDFCLNNKVHVLRPITKLPWLYIRLQLYALVSPLYFKVKICITCNFHAHLP